LYTRKGQVNRTVSVVGCYMPAIVDYPQVVHELVLVAVDPPDVLSPSPNRPIMVGVHSQKVFMLVCADPLLLLRLVSQAAG